MNKKRDTLMLSVIVPVYNVEEYLFACMESINKSIENIQAEVLLIDDGSTDGSSEIAKDYAAENSKFVYYRKKNGGLSDARNYGAARAGGKYICFVDSDDLVAESMYKNMIEAAEYHDADLTITNVVRFNSIKRFASTLHMKVFCNLDEQVSHISKCDNFIFDTTSWNKLIRRSFWESNGFQYPVGWKFEDMLVSLAMHSKANKVAVVREVGYLWRVRDGQTKSITQQNDTSENLRHRLKMLDDMFDYIQNELGGDKRLLKLLSHKVTTLDLMLYIDFIPSITDALYAEYRELILDFYEKHSLQEELSGLPVIRQQKYDCFFNDDREKLAKVIDFEIKEYGTSGYVESENSLLLDLPKDLFTVQSRAAKNDLEWSHPIEDCVDMKLNGSSATLYSYCYYPKVNIPEGEEEIFTADLHNVVTGEKCRLKTIRRKNENLIIKKAVLYDNYQGKRHDYDYDGAAFTLDLDLSEPEAKDLRPGRYMINLNYHGYAGGGNIAYRINNDKVRGWTDGVLLKSGNVSGTICFDDLNQLILVLEKDAAMPANELQIAENAGVCDGRYAQLSMRDGTLKTIDADSYAVVTGLKADADKVEIRVRFYPQLTGDNRMYLTYADHLAERVVTLAGAEPAEKNKSDDYIFRICMSDDSFSGDLYAGIRYPVISIDDGQSSRDIPVFADCTQTCTARTDGCLIYFRSDDDCRMMLDVVSRTKQIANFNKYLRKYEYPKLRKQPLNNKCILFEAYWGAQYSCNPRALYEYIDKNYPEYTCVWSFKDERIPIKGNGIRVRRFSPEYYHYLSTAKFLVNNVNFEDSYKKRKGQIEIQTMHGTPYKTLGLDVTSDFHSKAAIEKYIRKNSRWDYMVVQGVFSEQMADRWFRFSKEFLRTGYPRTDGLFNISKEEKVSIRKSLGIPEGKKTILYAPSFRGRHFDFNMALDLEMLKREFGEEYVLMIRLHHFDAEKYRVPEDGEFIFDMTGYSHIDDIFKIADILITDYSSVMFDFATTGRPEIFFAYDLEEYTEELRGCYFEIAKEAPGPLVKTNEELVEAIRKASAGETGEYEERRQAFMDKYLTYENGNSCEKIFKEVFEQESLRLEKLNKSLKERGKRGVKKVLRKIGIKRW